jgi:hydrogenase/urease accessory protein HupE
MLQRLAWIAGLLLLAPLASAHTMNPTLVLVSFAQSGSVDVKIDADLTLLLGSPERYYAFASEPAAQQQAEARQLAPRLLDNLQLYVGPERLRPVFKQFTLARALKSDFLDSSTTKASTFKFVAALPQNTGPLRLILPLGPDISYPIAYTVQIPAAHMSVTRLLDAGMHESDPFAWAQRVPPGLLAAGSAPAPTVAPGAEFDPDALPWPRQLLLYLRLGFRHIVPEGTDHILFVLGLFFLGITWRKLLSQTTVFTVAHATTLFLSTYGIFRLPSHIVEPAIALSIAYIALENVFKPRLGISRLAIVFGFGLIHGLGFASSLSDIPFPKHQFLFALLGFNFGVDFGQLFVIGLAFLAVGWFRNKPWFRPRIAIPCSVAIAAVGLVWAVQRLAAG